jgi:hypothetical protein
MGNVIKPENNIKNKEKNKGIDLERVTSLYSIYNIYDNCT